MLGEGWGGLRCDRKWQAKLKQAKGRDKWDTLEVNSDGGADNQSVRKKKLHIP